MAHVVPCRVTRSLVRECISLSAGAARSRAAGSNARRAVLGTEARKLVRVCPLLRRSSFFARDDRCRLLPPGGGQVSTRRVPAAGAPRAVMKESQALQLGMRAPDFELLEPLTGKMWSLQDFEGHPALLVMFICNHCPFVKHLKADLARITSEYIQKGVAVVAISSNSLATHPQDGPDEMARDARELNYQFPYLFDETQEVAKNYKAACTPDFYVFKKEGPRPFQLEYHGQLDDSRPRNGQPVTGRDIKEALDCVLSGRPVPSRQKPSIGCNIKWAPGKEPDYY